MGEPLEFCHEIDQIRLEAAKAEVAGGGGDVAMADQRLQVSISALSRQCNLSLKIPCAHCQCLIFISR